MFIQRRASYMNLDGISAMNKKDLSSDLYFDLLKSALCASLYDESAWLCVERAYEEVDLDNASIANAIRCQGQTRDLAISCARGDLRLVHIIEISTPNYAKMSQDFWPLVWFHNDRSTPLGRTPILY